MIKLINGDCLEKMEDIPDKGVDMVLADPPYGTTHCKWDSIIPLEPMWKQLKRIIKPNGAIVMTARQPFTTTLIASNMKMFKYSWVWEKSRATSIFHAKNKPLNKHEDIVIFSYAMIHHQGQKNRMDYNPQNVGVGGVKTNNPSENVEYSTGGWNPALQKKYVTQGSNYPVSILKINSETKTVHPTQKPVALMEYLIKTYTSEGTTVLDFAMGSGTTGVACKKLNRSFIGIELDEAYFKIAEKRINETVLNLI